MDFVETVAEINVPEYLMAILKDLFFNGRSLDKNIISDIIRLMKNTFVRFFGKTVYFRSLSESDQMLLTMKNLPLLVHYCLSRFETSDVGFDQFYWLLATYNPSISKLYSNYFHYSYFLCNVLKLISSVSGLDEINECNKVPLENILLRNGFIESETYFQIYKECSWKIIQSLRGCVTHPGLILHLILFNTESWTNDRVSKLLEKQRIKVGNIVVHMQKWSSAIEF